jgi:tRNA(fMet)-specific endonuclease VapC
MMPYLLDTDICIIAMSGRQPRLNQRIVRAGEGVSTSAIVLAELLYGVEKSQRQRSNLQQLEQFLAHLPVIEFDGEAARAYGSIRAHLERKGTPIGNNDMFIGAHARSRDFTLVTSNVREFERIPDLKIENWVA